MSADADKRAKKGKRLNKLSIRTVRLFLHDRILSKNTFLRQH